MNHAILILGIAIICLAIPCGIIGVLAFWPEIRGIDLSAPHAGEHGAGSVSGGDTSHKHREAK